MSVSDDHSEDDLLATVVPSVDTCSHIFMSRRMGRRQPAAHPLDNRTSERANIHTNFKFNKLTVAELCPMSINCSSACILEKHLLGDDCFSLGSAFRYRGFSSSIKHTIRSCHRSFVCFPSCIFIIKSVYFPNNPLCAY